MLVIGLTGSIGMGKSTVAARFRALGVAVCDADAEVHRLYAGAAVAPIEAAFPGTTAGGMVDREKLALALLARPHDLPRLEAIVHPLVLEAERAFLRGEAARGAPMAVLEIPLLLETGGAERVDCVVVASAPAAAQRERVLRRPGMTPEKLDQLLARQMPDAHKRTTADFVVDTGGTFAETDAQVDRIVASLQGRAGTAYARFWA
jgi:dephospho-CoA kinase